MTTSTQNQLSRTVLRPGFEGANIRTWIGFKHFLYLSEQGVLAWFRERGLGPSVLYHEYGLGLTVIDSSAMLPATLDVDDEVSAEVSLGEGTRFSVRLTARDGQPVMRGKVRVALVRESPGSRQPPAEVRAFVVDAIQDEPTPADEPASFSWSWRIPYFYCQYSDRLAHSGYVRAMEEVVDRFLAERGISVATMLDQRGWIPVVSRAGVRMLAAAHMEETVRTTFTVTDIVKNMMFQARVDFAVQREGVWVPTAEGHILHGYAISRGPGVGGLAEFDEPTLAALDPARS